MNSLGEEIAALYRNDFGFPWASSGTERRTVKLSRQECSNEQVRVQPGGQRLVGAILGRIADGLIGNQLGDRSGWTVVTAVGAAGGAVVDGRKTISD